MNLQPEQLEHLTKAAQTANLLTQDLRAAYNAACDGQPALEIMLRGFIGEAAAMEQKLTELHARYSE